MCCLPPPEATIQTRPTTCHPSHRTPSFHRRTPAPRTSLTSLAIYPFPIARFFLYRSLSRTLSPPLHLFPGKSVHSALPPCPRVPSPVLCTLISHSPPPPVHTYPPRPNIRAQLLLSGGPTMVVLDPYTIDFLHPSHWFPGPQPSQPLISWTPTIGFVCPNHWSVGLQSLVSGTPTIGFHVPNIDFLGPNHWLPGPEPLMSWTPWQPLDSWAPTIGFLCPAAIDFLDRSH